MAGKIKEINAKEFEKEVLNADKVVVDFYSTECPPCEALASKYTMLSELFGDEIKFIKIFRQENRELAEELGVTSSPTLLFYDNGKIVGEKLSGTGAVYTTRDDDGYVYKGGAASSIGRAAQFEIPIGSMTKEIAKKVMTKKFSGGCAMTNSKRSAAKYRVTMPPRITGYE